MTEQRSQSEVSACECCVVTSVQSNDRGMCVTQTFDARINCRRAGRSRSSCSTELLGEHVILCELVWLDSFIVTMPMSCKCFRFKADINLSNCSAEPCSLSVGMSDPAVFC